MVRLFSRKVYILVFLTYFSVLFSVPSSMAFVTDVETVVFSYLNSLANGDVGAIEGLIDGSLKQRTKKTFRNPERYGNFLRKLYDQASMSVVSITPVASNYQAKVQIVYPSGSTSSYVLVVSKVNGIWKITDEIMAGSP